MDVSPIISQMLHVFWYLIPLIVIGGIIIRSHYRANSFGYSFRGGQHIQN